jgi:hypothetical protein
MPDADQAALIAQNPLDFRVDHTALGGLGLRKVPLSPAFGYRLMVHA